MRYSCYFKSAFGSEAPIDFEEWAGFAASSGFDGIELITGSWPLDWWEIRKMVRVLERSDIAVSMVCTANNLCLEGEERSREIENILAHIELAEEVGSSMVRVMDGYWDRDAMLMSREKALRLVRAGFEECLERSGNSTVALAWENHPGNAGLKLDFFAEILEQISDERLCVNFDTANAARAGQNPFDFLNRRSVLERIRNVHVKDFIVTPDGWRVVDPLEGNVVPHREIFTRLKRDGYSGWISWEHGYGVPQREDLETARRVLSFIAETWNQG